MMEYEGEIFENLELDGEELEDIRFTDCHFVKCRFYELKLSGCTFVECTFDHCTVLNVRTKYTSAKNNGFQDCSVVGLDWAELCEGGTAAALPFDKLTGCTLKFNSFYRMKLRRADFQDNDLTGSVFEGCDLAEADFRGAVLSETAFQDNNMVGADFRGARDYAFAIDKNRLKKARFSFPDAINLLTASGIRVE